MKNCATLKKIYLFCIKLQKQVDTDSRMAKFQYRKDFDRAVYYDDYHIRTATSEIYSENKMKKCSLSKSLESFCTVE